MARRTSPAVDPRSKEGKAGLTQRLAERRERFWVDGRLVSVPVVDCDRWVEDKLKAEARHG